MLAFTQFLNPLRYLRFFVIVVFWLAVTAVATIATGHPQTVAGLLHVLPIVTFIAVAWHMAYSHPIGGGSSD